MNDQKTSLLDQIVQDGSVYFKDKDEKNRAKSFSILSSFIDIINMDETQKILEELKQTLGEEYDLLKLVKRLYAHYLDKLSKQIDEVIHDKEFTNLEGKWRGLHHLVKNCELGKTLMIKVLSVSNNDLGKDLLKASDFDQSKLFKKVYEAEYGTLGGAPFSTMIYDHYFDASNPSVEIMTKLTEVCAAAHCPCISGVSPTVFNIEDFRKINQSRDLTRVFQTDNRIVWNAFREKNDSRYMALTLPRVLARVPYSVENNPANGIEYNETVDHNNNDHFIWKNAAYALAVRIASAFSQFGWTAAIRGVEGGGLAEDLPVMLYTKEGGELSLKCPTEVSITDRREKELSDLGFVPLCHNKGSNQAVFFAVQSVQRPKCYENPNATANARMSSSLPYLLVASRFAHYINVMMRNKIGSFQTASDIEIYIQNWLSKYILLNTSATQELKSQMPLKGAQIQVSEVPGGVGYYSSVLWISPHLQLDELMVSIRLVSKIPKA